MIPATLLAEYRGAVEALYSGGGTTSGGGGTTSGGGGGVSGGGGSVNSPSLPPSSPVPHSVLIRQAQSDRLFEGYPRVSHPPAA